jgi:glycosyltransferase involved in cell wall biosynthesis
MVRVAIIATHPIQYQVPWFMELAEQTRLDLTVYYALIPDCNEQGAGFGIPFTWDIPMFEGYKWKALPSTLDSPGLQGFFKNSTPAVYSILKRERPDVVIITGWQSLPLLQALWTCMRLHIPRLVRGDSNALKKRTWWVRIIHRLLLSRFDAFLSVGSSNREFYLKNGVNVGRVFSSPHFIANQRFLSQYHQVSGDRGKIRAEWGIKPDDTCLMYAGKLEPKKRIMDLMQAFDIVIKTFRNVHLLIVGTGELMEKAERFAREKKLPVSFAGFLNQTEITQAYVAGDCLVLPSDYGETWGLVVNEAMACGLPVIVSDRVGCGPDLVEDGITGFVFPFGDIKALAGRIRDMLSDAGKRLQMGRNAQERIGAYSVEKAAEGTLQAIDYVLDRKV